MVADTQIQALEQLVVLVVVDNLVILQILHRLLPDGMDLVQLSVQVAVAVVPQVMDLRVEMEVLAS